MNMFSIGSDVWPGVSKVTEEIGELGQVLGKLLGTGGDEIHYDGSNLRVRMEEEVSDVQAALTFLQQANPRLDRQAIAARAEEKLTLFWKWHLEESSRK